MGLFARGDIVLVKFPFSDLTQSKLRPALVLAQGDYNDWLLCQITSQKHKDRAAVEITKADFTNGQLKWTSYARPCRIMTAAERIISRRLGTLTDEKHTEVVDAIKALLD